MLSSPCRGCPDCTKNAKLCRQSCRKLEGFRDHLAETPLFLCSSNCQGDDYVLMLDGRMSGRE